MDKAEKETLLQELAQALQKDRGSKYWVDISPAQRHAWYERARKLAYAVPTLRRLIWNL